MAKGFRLRVYSQAASPSVDLTFYVGVSGQTSSLANIPDVRSPEPDLATGTMRSQNVTFQLATETVTADLGDSADRIDWTGRLVDWSETTNDGSSYTVLWTGRIVTGPSELDGPGKYAITCQDENWFARGQKIFATSGGTTMLHPPGLTADWGTFKANPDPNWIVEGTDGADKVLLSLANNPTLTQEMADYFAADRVDSPISDRSDGDGNFEHLRFRDIDGAADREIISLSRSRVSITRELQQDNPAVQSVWLYWSSHGLSSGELVNGYLYAPTAEPHEMNPRHVGGVTGEDLGTFLEKSLDGTYNDRALRVDTSAALATYNESTNPNGLKSHPSLPVVLARVTEPGDLTTWLAEHVFAPLHIVPFVDSSGQIAPRLWWIPQDVSVASLTTLDASDSRVTAYDPRGQEAVTQLRFRVRAVLRALEEGGARSTDRISQRESVPDSLTQTHDNESSLGTRTRTYDLTAFGPSPSRVIYPHQYAALISDITRETFEREGDGPAWYTVETHVSTIAPGDCFVLDADTLKFPNPADNARTGDRIAQVATRVIRGGGSHYILECQDIGPSAAILSAPTVAVSANDEHSVDVTISGLSAGEGYRLYVDRNGDGVFQSAGTGTTNETATVRECASGTAVVAKAVTTKQGRIRSAFSATDSDTTTAITAPSSLSVTISGTTAILDWTVGDSEYPVMPRLDGASVLTEPLPAGSDRYIFRGLTASMSYDFGVRHEDEYGGASSTTEVTDTTGTAATLTAPRGLQVTQGRATASDPLPDFFSYMGSMRPGLEVRWSITETHARHMVEVSDDNFATTAQEIPVPQGVDRLAIATPLTAGLQYVRVKAQGKDFTDSAYTSTVSAYPTFVLPRAPMRDAQPFGAAWLELTDAGTPTLFLSTTDGDVSAAYYDADTGSFPAVTTADSSQAVADFGTAIDLTADADITTTSAGDTVYVAVRFYDGSTGTLGPAVYAKITRTAGVRAPVIQDEASQTGNTGTLAVTLTDPSSRVRSVRFKTHQGTSDFDFTDPTDGTWDERLLLIDDGSGSLYFGDASDTGTQRFLISSGGAITVEDTLTANAVSATRDGSNNIYIDNEDPPYSDSVALSAKHNSYIARAVGWADDGDVTRYEVMHDTYDADLIAEITGLSGSLAGDNEILAHVQSDEDSANVYVTVGKGSSPSDPTAGANDGTTASRSATISTGVTADTVGQVLYIKAVAADSAGTLGPVQEITFRPTPGRPDLLEITSFTVTDDESDLIYSVTWVVNGVVGASEHMHVEFYNQTDSLNVNSQEISNPGTTLTASFTDTGAGTALPGNPGDGDTFRVELSLQRDSDNMVYRAMETTAQAARP